MALILNKIKYGEGPLKTLSGVTNGCTNMFRRDHGALRGRFGAEGWSDLSGTPDGYRHPGAWVLPTTAGSLRSYGLISGTGSLSATVDAGVNIAAALAGTGAISSAAAGLIVSMVAALTGSGDLTASLIAALFLTADLEGEGTLTADVTAIANAAADLFGEGACSAISYAIGHLEADITPFTTLSPENLASAVWNALEADFNDAGTMGELLHDASAGGGGGGGGLTKAEFIALFLALKDS
jgi:hypothetical protein